MNTAQWLEKIRLEKISMPILSFPSVDLTGKTVKELISSSDEQARGMKAIADRCKAAAAVSMMDLSVEAEAFGAEIRYSDNEVPTVSGRVVRGKENAEALRIPKVGDGRTGRYIEAIGKAKKLITDRPVFAGVIGPFSLAGRLMDMTEIMIDCFMEPEAVHTVLRKTSEFIAAYIEGYKVAGADGVIIAEPAAGIISPGMNEEFSVSYLNDIVSKVKTDNFTVIYHNCGRTMQLLPGILKIGADAYHFGDAADMRYISEHIPEETVFMGNISPSREFKCGTPESVKTAVRSLLDDMKGKSNFVLSSGCDIPPGTLWENIDAFFAAAEEE
ncbi:MAG: methyltransferase [Clostridiales bacterium]|jgi:uroporphyrinogen decarboxylase|nr:methyltransferase [Clostridiales bacterium]